MIFAVTIAILSEGKHSLLHYRTLWLFAEDIKWEEEI